jgi:hypothetical protein
VKSALGKWSPFGFVQISAWPARYNHFIAVPECEPVPIYPSQPAEPPPLTAEEKKAARKKERAARPKLKNDPKLVAAARELRDRYTEQINAGLLLPPSAHGKYEVSRMLEAAPTVMNVAPEMPMLEAA